MASNPKRKRRVQSSVARLSARERRELAALERMPDSSIDLSDIPELTDWSTAQVGRFYRRPKTQR
jgi:hypothetical protein